MAATAATARLVRMHASPIEGDAWAKFVGAYWVLRRDRRTLVHTTERQMELKLTLKPGADWREFFEEATA